jgi:hypothetical protein
MKRFTQFVLSSALVFGLCAAVSPSASLAQGNFFNPGVRYASYPSSSYNSYSGYNPTYASSGYRPQYAAPYRSCSYTPWSYDRVHGYYFCTCSVRSSKYYCIYNTCYANCVYYYNPDKNCYWGRYDALDKSFSTLGPADQHATIAELPQDRFSAPTVGLAIPGVQTNEQISAPPALPTDNLVNQPAFAGAPRS